MFREGARCNDPQDLCALGHQCCYFASDLKLPFPIGKKSIRVCMVCKAVYVNNEKTADLEVHLILPSQGRDAEAPG